MSRSMSPSRTVLAAATVLVGTATSLAEAAPAERLRIFYGERVELVGLDARASAHGGGSAAPAAAPVGARFDAYGRRFDLALEPNSRLLPAAAARSATAQVYRGSLTGVPGSWVRLTVSGARQWGMIWDGRELYVLEPAAEAATNFVGPPPATDDATIVFRLSDAQTPVGSAQCGAVRIGERTTGLDAYASLVAELRQANGLPATAGAPGRATAAEVAPPTAAATATRRLQVSIVGDYQYTQRYGGTTGQDRVLSLFNNVDGIFSTQLGVQLEVVSATMLTTPQTSPFTATRASERLGELSTYRRARSALTATGLTHLVTGADVTGVDANGNTVQNTVGIAYIGALCSASFAASLSEASNSASLDTLVMAHEIGHNFGSEHDGEDGSVCESTPTTFLMAPTLNRSNEFSQCSLDTMLRDIAGAACLLPANVGVDLSLTAGGTPATAFVERTFTLGATIANTGGAAAAGATLQYTVPTGLAVVQATAGGGGSCSTQAGGATCSWATFAAGSNASVELTLRGTATGSYTVNGTVSAGGDVATANDSASWSVRIDAPPDLALELPLATAATTVGADTSLVANVRNAGNVAAGTVQVSVAVPAVVTVQSVAPSGACATSGTTVTCSFAAVAAGETRSITITARGAQAGSGNVQYSLTSPDDGTAGNNAASLAVTVTDAAPPPPTNPPPTPPPTTPATSGGGGGGALGGSGLLALAALAALGAFRRRAAAGRC